MHGNRQSLIQNERTWENRPLSDPTKIPTYLATGVISESIWLQKRCKFTLMKCHKIYGTIYIFVPVLKQATV